MFLGAVKANQICASSPETKKATVREFKVVCEKQIINIKMIFNFNIMICDQYFILKFFKIVIFFYQKN